MVDMTARLGLTNQRVQALFGTGPLAGTKADLAVQDLDVIAQLAVERRRRERFLEGSGGALQVAAQHLDAGPQELVAAAHRGVIGAVRHRH
jgi:hypothetical protein